MAKVITDEQNYQDIADAIRAKLGSADTYTPSEMAAAIGAISGGGADSPLDPEVVYSSTRPADWLKMPTAQSGEAYILVHIPADSTDGVPLYMIFTGRNGDSVSVEYGTSDSSGTFIPDSSLSQTWNITEYIQTISAGRIVPASAFGSPTSDGFKQIIMRISWSAPSNYASLAGNNRGCSGLASSAVDITMDVTGLNASFLGSGSNSESYIIPWAIKYAKMSGTPVGFSPRFMNFFNGCWRLLCVRSLFDLSVVSNMQHFFSLCYSLIALPPIDSSAVLNVTNMFQDCRSLLALPSIKLPSVTTLFTYIFYNCVKLSNADALVCAPTTLYYAFNGCASLDHIPAGIDFSHVTSIESAFYNTGLKGTITMSLPAVSNCSYAFSSCSQIQKVILTDMGSATNLTGMFSRASKLEEVDIDDTSACTNFNNTFYGCYSLKKLPTLDTSSCTNASQMFYGVPLQRFDLSQYDFSSITGTGGLSAIVMLYGQNVVIIGDTFGPNGITNTNALLALAGNYYTTQSDVKIAKTDATLQLAANASTVFANNAGISVYVPDNLLATYQADQYWSTLGDRLKGYSDWPY